MVVWKRGWLERELFVCETRKGEDVVVVGEY